jgi:hypothetical protein
MFSRSRLEKYDATPGTIGNQDSTAVGPALSRSSHSLFDHTAAEIGINQTAPRSLDCFFQTAIGNSLATRKRGERSGLEYLHGTRRHFVAL